MADIHVAEDLWSEGILEGWFVADGVCVQAGEAVAAVRIGEALHDIGSPANGRPESSRP
jgi:hypothetical protein